MALGYDGKLYILAFDHRGSFQKKMFGIEGDPTPEETERIADSKHLIFEGMVKAVDAGVDPHATGVLVDEQFGVFSRRYRVLRYDFRGYGRSSRPEPGKPYSHVSDLAAVMDAARVERAALIGNSMGGQVAVDFALMQPDGRSSFQALQNTLADLGDTNPDNRLFLDLEGRDPDDGVSDIAYEKGYFFLYHIEEIIGDWRIHAD